MDGALVKKATGQTWLKWDGSWSDRLTELMLGSNSNSGTAVPTINSWGRLRIWTANPGW